jgi:hypothetical protein
VDCIAITDHDEIAGAVEARAIGGVQVIVGEEISSIDGHVIGLFLEQRVPPRLPTEETAELIRQQGGLVLAPHPRALLCPQSLSEPALQRLLPWLDAIEVCNAQNPLWWEDAWVREFARRQDLTPYVGDDTHLRGYLAACFQVMPPFDGPREFLESLRQAELHPGRFGLWYVAAMGVEWAWRRVFQRPLPGLGVNAPAGRQQRTRQSHPVASLVSSEAACEPTDCD